MYVSFFCPYSDKMITLPGDMPRYAVFYAIRGSDPPGRNEIHPAIAIRSEDEIAWRIAVEHLLKLEFCAPTSSQEENENRDDRELHGIPQPNSSQQTCEELPSGVTLVFSRQEERHFPINHLDDRQEYFRYLEVFAIFARDPESAAQQFRRRILE